MFRIEVLEGLKMKLNVKSIYIGTGHEIRYIKKYFKNNKNNKNG